MKKRRNKVNKNNKGFTVDKNMRSYADDPAVKRKNEEAQKFMEKAGFPDESLWKK